ncbi:response regulator [Spirosoma endbachense]|uniref:histidine kinase n=2 Tax=Spirosoma endbachense TaxID=2666025 RepID=A0A6P1VR75_9BACT|nr:response regulator [Spirosoma endbachense]
MNMNIINYRPPVDISSETEKGKHKLFYNCCLITVLTILSTEINNIIFGFSQALFPTLFLGLVFLVISILFRKHKISLYKAANLYILSGSAQVVISIYLSNGFQSPVLFWSCLIPVYAFWLLNKKYAIFWLLVSISIPILFLILDIFNFKFSNNYDFYYENHKVWALLVCLFLIINIFFVVYDFEVKKKNAIDEVNVKNEELRLALIRLEAAKSELELAEKHKDLFIAQMSHEMRTPMNAIMGVGELLKTSDKKEQDELVDILNRSSKHLLYIIEDILDITKIQTGKFQFQTLGFDLKPLLKSVYESNKIQADHKNIGFRFHFENELPDKITGDPHRISQILNNLLNNSIKFTDKGEVRFIIKYDVVEKLIIFKVTDTGIGMSEQEVNKVFDIFSQANSDIHLKYGGTGMGLSITRQLVDLFKGKIIIKSKLGKGTIITVSLPVEFEVQEDSEEVIGDANQSMIKEDLAGLKILIAEDNETNKLIIRKILHSTVPSILIDFASDGDEVLAKIERSSYDIILMDIQMPKKNGLETTRLIRAHQDERINKTKIIALTAYARKAEIDKFLEAGMNDYATKPIVKDELIRKIHDSTVASHSFLA